MPEVSGHLQAANDGLFGIFEIEGGRWIFSTHEGGDLTEGADIEVKLEYPHIGALLQPTPFEGTVQGTEVQIAWPTGAKITGVLPFAPGDQNFLGIGQWSPN